MPADTSLILEGCRVILARTVTVAYPSAMAAQRAYVELLSAARQGRSIAVEVWPDGTVTMGPSR